MSEAQTRVPGAAHTPAAAPDLIDPLARSIAHIALAITDLATAQSRLAVEIQRRTLWRQDKDNPLPNNNVYSAVTELKIVLARLEKNVPSCEEILNSHNNDPALAKR